MQSDSPNDVIELLHKTVNTIYVMELESQVADLSELVQAIHANKEIVDIVTRHLTDNMNGRTVRMAMLLEATHQALSNIEPTQENVNKVASALKKSMRVLNQEPK